MAILITMCTTVCYRGRNDIRHLSGDPGKTIVNIKREAKTCLRIHLTGSEGSLHYRSFLKRCMTHWRTVQNFFWFSWNKEFCTYPKSGGLLETTLTGFSCCGILTTHLLHGKYVDGRTTLTPDTGRSKHSH